MVLTTASATYAMRFAENSNSLFVLDAEFPQEIVGSLGGHIEVSSCAPRVARLHQVLQDRPHYDPDDPTPKNLGATFAQLVDLVQASEAEIQTELDSAQTVVRVGDRYAATSQDAVHETLSLLFDSAVLKGWDPHRLPDSNDEIVAAVPESPAPLVSLAVRHFYHPPAEGFRTLDAQRTARFLAERALRRLDTPATAKRIPLTDFLACWQRLAPVDLDLEEQMADPATLLRGLALVDRFAGADHIRFFPASRLPASANDRFAAIFAKRSSWARDDIAAYLGGLVTVPAGAAPQQYTAALEKLLRTHCRVSRPVAGAPGMAGRGPMYSARTAVAPRVAR